MPFFVYSFSPSTLFLAEVGDKDGVGWCNPSRLNIKCDGLRYCFTHPTVFIFMDGLRRRMGATHQDLTEAIYSIKRPCWLQQEY